MSKRKATTIAAIAVIGLTAALLFAASTANLLLAGDYYVKIDNAHVSKNEPDDGVINFGSSEPYLYKLEAINAKGDRAEIEFGTYRELRQNAFLRLDLQPIRGVVGWSEVPEDALPAKVAATLS